MGESDSVLVNASTWGLMLTGKLVSLNDLTRHDVRGAFKRLVGRVGEPVIRLAVRQAMRIMGHQFVMGRTIAEALTRSRKGDNANYRYSFDMLGEGALTSKDAARYLEAYRKAIHAIGKTGPFADVFAAPSISIKLSALHPRYEHAKRERVMAELAPGILELAQLAKSYAIGFTIDAEEADRLELSLDLIEATFSDKSLDGWEGYGLAVQAYQKRTPVRARLPRRPGPPRRPAHAGAPGQGRVLGCGSEARAGRRPPGLSGVHPQAQYRRVLPGQRAAHARQQRRAVSDVRHAQRADHRRDPLDRRRPRLRAPETARHGRRPVCRSGSCRAASAFPAACTRRSARTRTCCPTWCGACWRTAPTPASSIASPTRTSPSTT